jgi:hypothetical protein
MSGRNNPAPDLPKSPTPCDAVRLDAVLVNVVVAVANIVADGEKHEVVLIENRYPAVLVNKKVVGSVASGVLSPLVECLRAGEEFEALILERQEAFVKVRIAHK